VLITPSGSGPNVQNAQTAQMLRQHYISSRAGDRLCSLIFAYGVMELLWQLDFWFKWGFGETLEIMKNWTDSF
jgi:hypothetical protein